MLRAHAREDLRKETEMEQIYTIPVNEAFDAAAADPTRGCPFCLLFEKLQEDELDIILGASMMEPDIRIRTNEQGFCADHYARMLGRKRKLGMGLILESHLAEVKRGIGRHASDLVMKPGAAQLSYLSRLEGDCYVCGRIDRNLSAMIATAVYLYTTDPAFRDKLAKQPYFCLPHYRRMTDYASKKLSRRDYAPFYKAASAVEEAYLETLTGDVSWFCKKFDYNYENEPWYNAKDAVERAIRFLRGGTPPDKA